MALLLDALSGCDDEVTIHTLDNSCSDPFFYLHPEVVQNKLGIPGAAKSFTGKLASSFKKYLELRRRVKHNQIDVVVSFTSEVNVLVSMALMGSGEPVVVSGRSDQ